MSKDLFSAYYVVELVLSGGDIGSNKVNPFSWPAQLL